MSIPSLGPAATGKLILAINGGSSSLKAAVFVSAASPHRLASATVERIGSPEATHKVTFEGQPAQRRSIVADTHEAALRAIMTAFDDLLAGGDALGGVGHRVVHGGSKYFSAEIVVPRILDELRKLEPFDPEHLPAQVGLIQASMRQLPNVPHIACFDTAFHRDLPAVARRLSIPRRFDSIGVRRYGFHGLSYSYLMSELQRIDATEAKGRVIMAHLGNGVSLAAVRNGRSVDTSMAFTPAAGVPMGTRSGDLDPGLIDFLVRVAGVTVEQFNHIVHSESGLLGISETSSDMQRLLELVETDTRAAEAVEFFCYQVRKWIGSYAAALGGLDTLVFAGGIGERASEIRWRICSELKFLGIDLDATLNRDHAALISTGSLAVKVRVIATDEEQMIANEVIQAIPKADN